MAFPTIQSDGGVDIVIYSTNAGSNDFPIHGAYYSGKRWRWTPTSWDREGYRSRTKAPSDLNITKAIQSGAIKVPLDTQEEQATFLKAQEQHQETAIQV